MKENEPEDPRLAPLRENLEKASHVEFVDCPKCGCKTAVPGVACPNCDEEVPQVS